MTYDVFGGTLHNFNNFSDSRRGIRSDKNGTENASIPPHSKNWDVIVGPCRRGSSVPETCSNCVLVWCGLRCSARLENRLDRPQQSTYRRGSHRLISLFYVGVGALAKLKMHG